MLVNSSNIKSAEYDRRTLKLTMVFINRPTWVYTYSGVSLRVWGEFLRSESKGTYFSHNIRDVFPYKKTIKKRP